MNQQQVDKLNAHLRQMQHAAEIEAAAASSQLAAYGEDLRIPRTAQNQSADAGGALNPVPGSRERWQTGCVVHDGGPLLADPSISNKLEDLQRICDLTALQAGCAVPGNPSISRELRHIHAYLTSALAEVSAMNNKLFSAGEGQSGEPETIENLPISLLVLRISNMAANLLGNLQGLSLKL